MVVSTAAMLALGARQNPAPSDEGRELTERFCGTACHGLETVTASGRTSASWAFVVDEMIGLGADPSEAQAALIVSHLAQEHPPTVNVNTAAARQIAEVLEIPMAQAVAIVSHREAAGAFRTWEDVASIDGIDPEHIKQHKSRLLF